MTSMSYDEATIATVTRAQAKAEIERHDIGTDDPWLDFVRDHGEHDEYSGKAILDWLGY